MLRRIVSLIVLVWLLGFIWFAIALPGPLDAAKSDGVVVLTGGGGRIGRGLEVLEKGWSRKLLVSGVDREVRPGEFQAEYKVPPALMACCVTLGFQSVDTRSNAREAADWMAKNKIRSVRLVTTDWHMRRAAMELGGLLPDHVEVIRDAVPSQPSLRNLFLEYNKLLARTVQRMMGQ
ncbi:YdcF family protein [Novosphingobium sp. G106]|uniref:YdcF family protein n=1 Tax=Novosphingobium sp. G106 TaxID=2849500 RepID=UPI001C2CDE10|nr:YdcF family protein [Novosphingobium sp. G106]MBV1690789.1 YdcF family protein [Novosphingobium sp. G106]